MNQLSIATVARNLFLPLIAGALLAGCGGGASNGLYGNPRPMPSTPPVSGTLSTAQLNGAPGFVNSASHTVYVFDADLASPGQSNCSGACAQNWPPVLTASAMLPSPWSKITRSDGGMQLVYKGRPLYTFAFDANPGDTNGDGVNAFGGLWHIARP